MTLPTPPANHFRAGIMTPPLLRFDALSVALPAQRGALFAPIDLTLHPGEMTVISAPSGHGKSPALRAAIGAQPRTTGTVTCLGRDLSQLTAAELLLLRRRVGFVPAKGGLLSNLGLHDNLTLLWRYHDLATSDQLEQRAKEVCSELGLGDLHGRPLATASYLERHLIAIGRAWLPHPPLLILDEPTFGLDEETAIDVWRRLAALRKRYQVAMLTATSHPGLALRFGGTHLPLQPAEAP
ncbi:MAG: ATP-binding cassette domain-containing protein [Myxococcales bacterium]|nr:ATP-binding cassette domain-containing protein [Myxococcales bacterium]